MYIVCSVKPSMYYVLLFHFFFHFFSFRLFFQRTLVPRSLAVFFLSVFFSRSFVVVVVAICAWKRIRCIKRPNVLCASYKQSRRKSILNIYYLLLFPPVVFTRSFDFGGASFSLAAPKRSRDTRNATHTERRRGPSSNRRTATRVFR